MALDLYMGGDISCKSENDMQNRQFYAVELSGADLQVDVPDNAGDRVFGVAQDNPPANVAVTVRILGVTKWVSDGSGTAIAVGDPVGTDATGKCVQKSGAGALVAGTALSASSADGTVIDVLLTPNAVLHA